MTADRTNLTTALGDEGRRVDALKAGTGPVVAVLVVNYFSADAVEALLRSLSAHRDGCTVLVSIVDNSCDAGQAATLASRVPLIVGGLGWASVTPLAMNVGYGSGNNAAWEALATAPVQPDVVLVVNPDIAVVGGSLAALAAEVMARPEALYTVRTMESKAETTGLSRLVKVSGRSTRIAATRVPVAGTEYPGGHFLAMSTQQWIELGGFSSRYFLYCEEVDLTLRHRDANGSTECVSSSAVVVEHVGGMTTRAGQDRAKSLITHFHASRSRVLLYRSHASLRRYTAAMIAIRLFYAGVLVLALRPREGMSVIKGLRSGFAATARIDDERSAGSLTAERKDDGFR